MELKKIDKYDSLIINSSVQIVDGIELFVKVSKSRMYIIDYNIDFNDVSLNKKMCKLKNNSIISVLLLKDAFYRYLIETHNKIRNTSKGLSYEKCIELISQSK